MLWRALAEGRREGNFDDPQWGFTRASGTKRPLCCSVGEDSCFSQSETASMANAIERTFQHNTLSLFQTPWLR